MRFTVHRPPCGEVSLRWYRPSGGDVACSVHVGVTRPRLAGDARENRLALAVFGCDVPAGGASLRRVRGRDPFDSARGLVVKPGNEGAPRLTTDRTAESPFLRHPNAGSVNGAARGVCHRPHVEFLHSNSVKPARKIGRRLFHPVASPVRFARFDSRDRQFSPLSTVGAALGSCEALLQPAQPDPFTRCEARGVQQLPGGQCRRHCHPAIDPDHAAIRWSRGRVGDVRERDVPATCPVPSDAVGLDVLWHGPGPSEADPPDLRHPYPPVAPVELFDMARLHPDLPEALMHAGLAPRRAPMGAGEEVPHGLCEIPQRLLLHRLRPGRQPTVFGADLSQLRRLLVVTRGAAARLPKLLLLHGQVPDEPRMPAMLQQRHLLSGRRQQPEPRHTRNLANATDTNGDRAPTYVGIGFPPRHKCPGFPSKEFR